MLAAALETAMSILERLCRAEILATPEPLHEKSTLIQANHRVAPCLYESTAVLSTYTIAGRNDLGATNRRS